METPSLVYATTRRIVAITFGLAIAAAPALAHAGPGGWQLLLHNRNTEARAAFRAALHVQPAAADARVGEAVLSTMEDNVPDAVQAWRDLYHEAAATWQGAAWWPQFVETARETGRWDLLAGAARDVIAARGAAPELRASAQLALADVADRTGRSADAEATWRRMGFLRQWRVCGPFDNVSRSGFDRAYAPETSLNPSGAMVGQDNRPLRWHALGLVSRDGQCNVASALGDAGACVFYATTAVYSPREQKLLLRLDPTGATKVWLNGRLIFSDAVYRTRQWLVADPFRAEAAMRAGWNTLLIKTADDEGSAAAFATRFTTLDGGDVSGLQEDPRRTGPPAEAGGTVSPAEPAPAAAIRGHLGGQHSVEPSIALAQWQRRTGDYTAAVETLRSAVAAANDCGWLRAELWRALQADGQLDEAQAERDAVRKLNPHIVTAELDYLSSDRGASGAAARISRLKELQRFSPNSPAVRWAMSDAYGGAHMTAESVQAARSAVLLCGGPDYFHRLIALLQRSNRGAEAQNAVDAALRTYPNDPQLVELRAEMLSEESHTDAAILQYERLVRIDPSDPSHRETLATLYRAARNPKRAAEELSILRQQEPQDSGICAHLGDVLKERGRTGDAIALYREAIRLDPGQVALREKLQVVAGEQPAMNLVPPTPSQAILVAAKASKGNGASAVVFLDEARHLVYPDFATVERVHKILKVFDQAAVERYQNYPLARPEASASVTVESAKIYKPDGKVQDVTESGDDSIGTDAVALPSLAPGDVIDISYRVDDYRSGALSKAFWTAWFFSISDAPVKLSRFVVMAPAGLDLHITPHGRVPDPSTRDVKGWSVREWRMTDITAHRTETLGTGMLDSGTWLDVSTVGSWRDIVRWYRDLSQPRCVPDATIRAKAAELTRGATSETDKVRAIFAFVRSIQYQTTPFRLSAYIPTEGKQVLRERYADCKDKAALLTALLAAVGVRSDMVLLNLRSQGITPYLPSTRFSHAIAVVHTAQGPLWIDATADQMRFGSLPCEDQGVPALVIDDATTDLTTSPTGPTEADRLQSKFDVSLGQDGTLSGTMELEATGNWSWILRSALKSVPASKRDEVLRSVASQVVKQSVYESGSLENVDDPDAPLAFHIRFHADNYATKAGNFLLAPIPWEAGQLTQAEAMLADPARTQDIEIAPMCGVASCAVHMKLPAGYAVQDLQPVHSGKSPWVAYRIEFHAEASDLRAEFEERLGAQRVPLARRAEFLNVLHAIEQNSASQIVLKKAS